MSNDLWQIVDTDTGSSEDIISVVHGINLNIELIHSLFLHNDSGQCTIKIHTIKHSDQIVISVNFSRVIDV